MGGLILLAGNLASFATGFITSPLTARSLGVGDRGAFSVFQTVAALTAVLFSVGLPWSSRSSVAAGLSNGSEWLQAARNAILLASPIMVPVCIGMVFWQNLTGTAAIAGVLLLIVGLQGVHRAVAGNVLLGLGRSSVVGIAGLFQSLLTMFMIVVLASTGLLDLTTGLISVAAGFIIQGLVLFGALPRRLAKGEKHPKDPRQFTSYLLQLTDGLSSRLDVLVVSLVGSHTELGLYAVISILPQVCYQAYQTVIQLIFAKRADLASRERFILAHQTCLGAWLILAMPGGVASYFFIGPVFGHEYLGARNFIVPAMVMALALGLFVPTVQVYPTKERPARPLPLRLTKRVRPPQRRSRGRHRGTRETDRIVLLSVPALSLCFSGSIGQLIGMQISLLVVGLGISFFSVIRLSPVSSLREMRPSVTQLAGLIASRKFERASTVDYCEITLPLALQRAQYALESIDDESGDF